VIDRGEERNMRSIRKRVFIGIGSGSESSRRSSGRNRNRKWE
jgi:hypothetical protein